MCIRDSNYILLNKYEDALKVVNDVEEKFGISLWGMECKCYLYVAMDKDINELFDDITVRRHIVGGTYRTLISVQNPLRLCRTGICRSLSAG